MASAGGGGLPRASLLSAATDIVETFGSRARRQGVMCKDISFFLVTTEYISKRWAEPSSSRPPSQIGNSMQ
jgi:hypothetical protein